MNKGHFIQDILTKEDSHYNNRNFLNQYFN